jgi:ribonuclease HI
MELLGIIKGLHALRARVSITIYSDSAYVVNAFLQRWLYGWQQNGWRTASKKPVKNVDLWQQLLAALQPHQYTFVKVKGHADNYYNNRCDYLAVAAIDKS